MNAEREQRRAVRDYDPTGELALARLIALVLLATSPPGLCPAPTLPGLSDKPSQLADVVKAAREAGACSVWANLLYLRPGTREHFLDCLARDWPEELDRYARLYANGRAYLGAQYTKPIREQGRGARA